MQAAQVPEDRLRMGLVRTFAAEESAILGYHKDPLYNAGLFMNGEAIRRDCVEKMRRFDVRPQEPTLTTANFSGGNQQKIVLARELSRAPRLDRKSGVEGKSGAGRGGIGGRRTHNKKKKN